MSSYELQYDIEEDTKRIARLLGMARTEGNLSQEKMAMELGIAKKTVQNWEKGVSAPSMPQLMSWLQACKVPVGPYIMQIAFPHLDGIKGNDDDKKVRNALIEVVRDLPSKQVRQLLYLFFGDHGSSPKGNLEMLTAHLQSPMRDRLAHATQILDDYLLAAEKGTIRRPEHIQPDVAYLEKSIAKGRKAVIEDRESY